MNNGKAKKPHAVGNTASIFIENNQVIKIYNDNIPSSEALFEGEKQKYVYSLGLPTPEVLKIESVEGRPALYMEYINGDTLGSKVLSNKKELEKYLIVSINWQQKIHQYQASDLPLWHGRLQEKIKQAPFLNDVQMEWVLNHLSNLPVGRSLCHGDFHLFNIIQDVEENIYIIDWVDAVSGCPEADICRTYLLYIQYSKEIADLYIRLIQEKTTYQLSEVYQWLPVLAAARLTEGVSGEEPEHLIAIIDSYMN